MYQNLEKNGKNINESACIYNGRWYNVTIVVYTTERNNVMINILLVCSAGMSTSMLMRKMQDEASARGVEAHIWAVGGVNAREAVDAADVVLLGPQIRFQKSSIEDMAKGKPVAVIDMEAYGCMNGAKVLDFAIELYNNVAH